MGDLGKQVTVHSFVHLFVCQCTYVHLVSALASTLATSLNEVETIQNILGRCNINFYKVLSTT